MRLVLLIRGLFRANSLLSEFLHEKEEALFNLLEKSEIRAPELELSAFQHHDEESFRGFQQTVAPSVLI